MRVPHFKEATAHLLARACPSIQYRVRRDLLGEARTASDMRGPQDAIEADPQIAGIIRTRQPNGWLGDTFHGAGGIEAHIRVLCEKGLECDRPILRNALASLEQATDRLAEGIGKVGRILDEMNLGGSELIRAALFAQAGVEGKPFVEKQVQGALARFFAAGDVKDFAEITEEYRGKRVFRQGCIWPSIYDLRLLAYSQAWRTPARLRTAARALQRMIDLSPIPEMHAKWKSQIIAPASFGLHNLASEISALTAGEWAVWFHRMELFARLGVIQHIPKLWEQTRALGELLTAGDGLFVWRT